MSILFNSVSKHPHPTQKQLATWVQLALDDREPKAEVSIYLVDAEEGLALNKQYRGKDYATNVLAFPAKPHRHSKHKVLGDLVFCVPVIETEAKHLDKTLDEHFAHLAIHGTLHLLGYDHINPEDANIMESIEIKLLEQLSISNPYELPLGAQPHHE